MSPERAQVVVIEDNQDRRDVLREFLEHAGHQVIDQADSVNKAIKLIDKLVKITLEDNRLYIILDGSLSEETGGTIAEGDFIAKEFIKKLGDKTMIIGNAGGEDIPSAHVNCPKNKGIRELLETLKRL